MKFPKVKSKPAIHDIDMCSGSILKKMILFAVPIMFSGILQILFNAADIIVVGQFAGDNALAAVGANTSFINLLTNLFMGLSIGANVLIARLYGAKNQKDLDRAVHTAMLLSIYSGILMTIIGITSARYILVLMKTPAEVLDQAVVYLRIYFIGVTSTMIYNFGSAVLRAIGDTKRPLYFLIIAGIINVILNLIFVIVFGMGVAGVAIATAIAQSVAAFLIIKCLSRKGSAVCLVIRHLHIHKNVFFRILKIGLPAGIQGIIFSLSNVVIQSSVNLFGETVVAGNSAAANIESFAYFSMTAFYQATISFTSQNFGAGKYKRINKIFIVGEICVFVVGICIGNAIALGGSTLLCIYTSNPSVIEAGMHRIAIICTTYVLCGMMEVVVGALRGIGYSIIPMLVSLVGVCGIRLVWIATVFQKAQYHNPTTVYLSYPISWVITFLVLVICFIILKKKISRSDTRNIY